MRPLHELLKLLLEHLPTYLDDGLCKGLCSVIDRLRIYEIITLDEYFALRNYTMSHASYYRKTMLITGGFFWINSLLKPRIAWLKRHIKLTQKLKT